MQANSMCLSCILSKQEKLIRPFQDEHKKSQYLHQVLEILYQYGQTESSPWLVERINQLYETFWGITEDYTTIKQKFNRFLLNKEKDLEKMIRIKRDTLKECIKYVCAANYIDFSAVEQVTKHTLETLLAKAKNDQISEEEYQFFRKDLENAKQFVYLTDNCGEIVLDKLFLKFIKEQYPQLQITAIVRGKPVINDATLEDAQEVGLCNLVSCMGNGNGAPGTVVKRFSPQARQCLSNADLILSKGQGNFEGLMGEGFNPYYLFLCKCELFVRRFELTQFQSVFVKEERVKVAQI